MNAPNKHPAPAADAAAAQHIGQPETKPRVPAPVIGEDVYFFDAERPREFNTMGAGPYAAKIVQVWKDEASGKTKLECGIMVFSDQGVQNHAKVVHQSQVQETRARRYWTR